LEEGKASLEVGFFQANVFNTNISLQEFVNFLIFVGESLHCAHIGESFLGNDGHFRFFLLNLTLKGANFMVEA
jgi:hypothetical protein